MRDAMSGGSFLGSGNQIDIIQLMRGSFSESHYYCMSRLHLKRADFGNVGTVDSRYLLGDIFLGLEDDLYIMIEQYRPSLPGPYFQVSPDVFCNGRSLTFNQMRAVVSSTMPGLTLVVGAPGTGKTSVASLIVYLLFYNFVNERTLVVGNSNRCLNDLVSRIHLSDIPSRFLLRLGFGVGDFAGQSVRGAGGRLKSVIHGRLALLSEIERLAGVLKIQRVKNYIYSCESCCQF